MSINCNNISVSSDAFLFVTNEWGWEHMRFIHCEVQPVWGEEINKETKETYDTTALVLNAIWPLYFFNKR